ncbi:protein-disulfide reductase, partial [Klebsiella pneumoniae]
TLSRVLADSGQAQENQIAVAAGTAAPGLAIGWVLLMALAGGLILNVMPCVLPVLAMKLGSLLQTEGRELGSLRLQFL